MRSACPAPCVIRSKEVEKRTCWLAASSRRVLIAHQLNAECIWTPLKSSRRNQLYNTLVLSLVLRLFLWIACQFAVEGALDPGLAASAAPPSANSAVKLHTRPYRNSAHCTTGC